jgi:hypothetical protein
MSNGPAMGHDLSGDTIQTAGFDGYVLDLDQQH